MRILGLSAHTWLLAIRPKTLPASIVPVCMGVALVIHRQPVNGLTVVVILLAALLLQIASNLVNDLADFEKGADTAERTGPLRVTQAGLATPVQMRHAATWTVCLALLLGCYLVVLGGLPILLIGIASILSAIAYTAGPFPLGYLGLGELFVLIFFGPVAVAGTAFLLSGSFLQSAIFAGLSPGLIASAILAVNNLRDCRQDQLVGKKTLAARFGTRFARCEYLALLGVAAVIPLYQVRIADAPRSAMLASLYIIPALPVIRTVLREQNAAELNAALERTGKLLVLFGILFCLGWLLPS